ncbi:MAG: AmmeMemoRadiSam system protein A [Desulfurococcales archaeon]|nr:AmmeMemoRadiSam system protein A [Desulfurococcales archaeon]
MPGEYERRGEDLEKPVDPEELTEEEGTTLVRLARKSVEYFFKNRSIMPLPDNLPPRLLRPGAAFVTIEKLVDGERSLRGCIGVIRPIDKLAKVVVEVALESAFNDPRFPPLREEELDSVIFEVSVLSDMEYIGDSPQERVSNVVIGRDGLLVVDTLTGRQGLLLPEVPIDYMWDVETFLSQTCVKAGLYPSCWKSKTVKVYRFRARVWWEKSPRGPIEERNLREEYLRKLRETKPLK